MKQCIEANRHNAVTAHYYLLMKKKILEGELLEDASKLAINITNDLISSSAFNRVNKSVLGPRTTKNGQHLRKIAEGLGDFNISKITATDIMQPSRETR